LANRAIKPVRIGYTKWLGLFRQPQSRSILPVDDRSNLPGSPVVTRSFSDNNVTLETTTTSNNNPKIPVEPVTPSPQGVDIQEIVRQSHIGRHSALAHIKQTGRPLNQPLDFSDIQEKIEGIVLLSNNLGDNTINLIETPTLGVEGFGIPPSPPG
jgi:hypothetical protein